MGRRQPRTRLRRARRVDEHAANHRTRAADVAAWRHPTEPRDQRPASHAWRGRRVVQARVRGSRTACHGPRQREPHDHGVLAQRQALRPGRDCTGRDRAPRGRSSDRPGAGGHRPASQCHVRGGDVRAQRLRVGRRQFGAVLPCRACEAGRASGGSRGANGSRHPADQRTRRPRADLPGPAEVGARRGPVRVPTGPARSSASIPPR